MARRKSSRGITHTGDILPPPPAIPESPVTAEDLRKKQEILRRIEELTDMVKQQNLDRAVVLARMAARRQGPLVEFFQKLGLQYYKLADYGPGKPELRVIKGDAE